jgi:hypothetical protein
VRDDRLMEARFTRRDDRVIDVHLEEAWRALEETLLDAVTTRAPAGSDGVNPSTYWLDRTLAAIDGANDGAIVASGNATELVVYGQDVVVHSQYDTFDEQRVRRADLVALLNQWRAEVVSELKSAP